MTETQQSHFLTAHIFRVELALIGRANARAAIASQKIAAQFATARRADGQRWRKLKKDIDNAIT